MSKMLPLLKSLTNKNISCISRGQVLPAASLLNSVTVDLIYEGVKYCLKVSASFPAQVQCLTHSVTFSDQ